MKTEAKILGFGIGARKLLGSKPRGDGLRSRADQIINGCRAPPVVETSQAAAFAYVVFTPLPPSGVRTSRCHKRRSWESADRAERGRIVASRGQLPHSRFV